MTWIKICGTTSLDDAQLAIDAGADALGFVFYENSPRHVDPEVARQIVRQLPAKVEKVGVCVDRSATQIRALVDQVGLTAIQVHSTSENGDWLDELLSARERLGVKKLIVAVPATRLSFMERATGNKMTSALDAVLVDSASENKPGGTGKKFDWQSAQFDIQKLKVPVIVAGGLTPANVTEAMNDFHPFGVDVASGVEARPGKKDAQKVRAFIDAVRSADKRA